MTDNRHMHAVPNPPETPKNETRELIKTVALTSLVSSLVGVFAVAGGQALYALIKRAIKGKKVEAPAQPQQQGGAPMPPMTDFEDMPESLRMEPRLVNTAPRRPRRKRNRDTNEEIARMFSEFETRMSSRLDAMERRMDEVLDEEDDYEDEEDDAA
ncbi:MAG: hypothetical protein K0U16_07260 [Gammaproteobacteria bacterium]|nr:hypothetical protein [Gammaproteobacteria bacterium]